MHSYAARLRSKNKNKVKLVSHRRGSWLAKRIIYLRWSHQSPKSASRLIEVAAFLTLIRLCWLVGSSKKCRSSTSLIIWRRFWSRQLRQRSQPKKWGLEAPCHRWNRKSWISRTCNQAKTRESLKVTHQWALKPVNSNVKSTKESWTRSRKHAGSKVQIKPWFSNVMCQSSRPHQRKSPAQSNKSSKDARFNRFSLIVWRVAWVPTSSRDSRSDSASTTIPWALMIELAWQGLVILN